MVAKKSLMSIDGFVDTDIFIEWHDVYYLMTGLAADRENNNIYSLFQSMSEADKVSKNNHWMLRYIIKNIFADEFTECKDKNFWNPDIFESRGDNLDSIKNIKFPDALLSKQIQNDIDAERIQFFVLDTSGQGDSFLLMNKNLSLIIDGGNNSKIIREGKISLAFLKPWLDKVTEEAELSFWISHGDNDHIENNYNYMENIVVAGLTNRQEKKNDEFLKRLNKYFKWCYFNSPMGNRYIKKANAKDFQKQYFRADYVLMFKIHELVTDSKAFLQERGFGVARGINTPSKLKSIFYNENDQSENTIRLHDGIDFIITGPTTEQFNKHKNKVQKVDCKNSAAQVIGNSANAASITGIFKIKVGDNKYFNIWIGGDAYFPGKFTKNTTEYNFDSNNVKLHAVQLTHHGSGGVSYVNIHRVKAICNILAPKAIFFVSGLHCNKTSGPPSSKIFKAIVKVLYDLDFKNNKTKGKPKEEVITRPKREVSSLIRELQCPKICTSYNWFVTNPINSLKTIFGDKEENIKDHIEKNWLQEMDLKASAIIQNTRNRHENIN